MARNAEKAMTTLARWRRSQVGEQKQEERRPYLATECKELPKAEKWRTQIVREIARKVAQIQNAGLGEFRIRDLNDEINKLIREKSHWEVQIKELGGPDYARIGPRMLDHEGKEVPGNRGYKYFGAAKDLPGVRELFEHEPPPPPRKSKAELMKDIDADYYGYRDDDDDVLIPLEREQEKIARQHAVLKWKKQMEEGVTDDDESAIINEKDNVNAGDSSEELSSDDECHKLEREENRLAGKFIAHVPVPSQKEIEAALLQQRKTELLQRYASDMLVEEEKRAKELVGIASDEDRETQQ